MNATENIELLGREVTTDEDVERVRVLRNQVRSYMTRHTASIGPEEQLRWWLSLDRERNRLFLFDVRGVSDGVGWRSTAGYGFNRLIGDRWWLSGALANEWQGKGLGKRLFAFLVAEAGKPCWLEVRGDNMRARNTYKKLGFVEAAEESGILTMVNNEQ